MLVARRRGVRSGIVAMLVVCVAGTGHADRLVESRAVARGDYMAPRYSPDGRELAVSTAKLKGLHLLPVDGSAPARPLTEDDGAGVHARWAANGTIAYRAVRAGARQDLVVDRAGNVRTRDVAPPVAFAQDDRVYVRDRAGQMVRVGTGDRFFSAIVSPDGDKVALEGLVTGIHIFTRSTGVLVRVGSGTAPAWSPDGARLAFERTEDDGHAIVASDLFIYHVATRRLDRLTVTDDRIERRPSFAPDGARLAFDDNAGAIYVGRLEVTP